MHTAICAFQDRARAEQAVDSLVRSGFARHDLHIQHKEPDEAGREATDGWDGMEREIAVDPGVLRSFGNFFASLFGRDRHAEYRDTYVGHVERGSYVVVVDAHDAAEAERARTLLQQMEAGELNVIHREDQRPLRDVVGMRQEEAGMVERSRESYEGWSNDNAVERERALAAHRVSPTTGPDLRDPDVTHTPGLRYADKDKPNG